MLKYHGQSYEVCTCNDGVVSVPSFDPTGTAGIRRALNTSLASSWRQVAALIREQLVSRDLLGLKSQSPMASMMQMQVLLNGSDKLEVFKAYLDSVLQSVVTGNASVKALEAALNKSYAKGVKFAGEIIERRVSPTQRDNRVSFFVDSCLMELRGIAATVIQQSMRAIAYGINANSAPTLIMREVSRVIEGVGVKRTDLMVEDIVVRAYGNAALDVYEAAGIEQVGLIAESRPLMRVQDASRKVKRPGSRTRTRTPSRTTIYRIERLERELEQALGKWVRVQTAGDSKVCKVCEAIEEDGPYTIDQARSLIPAHPRCRCAFIPARAPRRRKARS